jgi:hypothetical protein
MPDGLLIPEPEKFGIKICVPLSLIRAEADGTNETLASDGGKSVFRVQ